MADQWQVSGKEHQTTGHGESEERIVILNTEYPMLRLLVCPVYSADNKLHEDLARNICALLNRYMRQY